MISEMIIAIAPDFTTCKKTVFVNNCLLKMIKIPIPNPIRTGMKENLATNHNPKAIEAMIRYTNYHFRQYC